MTYVKHDFNTNEHDMSEMHAIMLTPEIIKLSYQIIHYIEPFSFAYITDIHSFSLHAAFHHLTGCTTHVAT